MQIGCAPLPYGHAPAVFAVLHAPRPLAARGSPPFLTNYPCPTLGGTRRKRYDGCSDSTRAAPRARGSFSHYPADKGGDKRVRRKRSTQRWWFQTTPAEAAALDTAWRTVATPAVMLYGRRSTSPPRAAAFYAVKLFRNIRGWTAFRLTPPPPRRGGGLTLHASPLLFGSAKSIEVENVASAGDEFLTDTLAT